MKKHNLSKSQFIRGIQCHKSLWLHKYKPELREEPDAQQQVIFDTGSDVGILAQQLFPGGEELVFSRKNIEKNITKTQEYIRKGVKTIYEATFKYDDILVMVDILHKGKKGWELYEIKSSTANKKVYENDIAVQYFVLNGSGLDIVKTSLVHINNQYVRKGKLEIEKLFAKVNVTKEVKNLQDFVQTELKKLQTLLGKKNTPKIDIGLHCSDPYPCDFTSHCRKHLPDVSIFNLYKLNKKKKFALYNDGITDFKDIPAEYPLTNAQQIQVEAEFTGKEIINKDKIKAFLETVCYPIYFLDFETVQQAVPQFDNLSPYVQIPFQYSLHILEKPIRKKMDDAALIHKEFLGEIGKDPRRALAKKLTEDIPDNVCVMSYNMSFEKGRIKELSNLCPEYADHLIKINDNMIDLLVPFRSKFYYTKEMNGSASIKYVLPALIPKLTYSGMAISNGADASGIYGALHLKEDNNEIQKIKNDLFEYCKLDTYAMVVLLEKLYQATR